ncbi:MAG: hypothetical protein J2P36_19465, partial [Ktedonobacteraceae bacterium]|nr:hypothetical protein [Ktedonobacteraceae bacterium]
MCNVCQHDSKSGHVKICRRQAIKTAFGIAAAVAAGGLEIWKLAPGAQATNHVPTVIGCGSWGARPSRGPIPVLTSKPKKIIVHHTAFPNSTDYTLGHACKLARDIQNLHMGTNGWIDTGQHFLVSRGGYLLEGRHRSLETLQTGDRMVLGTHCPG